jgi:hypothetical protein
MSFSWLFGSFFEIFIVITIVRVIYKSVIKGKSATLDTSIKTFVNKVKNELEDSKPSASKKVETTYKKDSTKNQTSKEEYYAYSSNPQEKYENADDLLKAGLITKEEYRKIKK